MSEWSLKESFANMLLVLKQYGHDKKFCIFKSKHIHLFLPVNDTMFNLSFFWPSDTERRINELRFSDSILLSFKMRLTSVTCFCEDVT